MQQQLQDLFSDLEDSKRSRRNLEQQLQASETRMSSVTDDNKALKVGSLRLNDRIY
jgi:septal ring factor EnvC (AmiA/AmiB activator)